MLSCIVASVAMAAWISVGMNAPLMILPVFLVTFCAVELVELAWRSGVLLRGCCAGAVLIAGFACAQNGAPWTFIWVFTLSYIVLMLLAFLLLVIVCGKVDLNEPQAEHDDKFYRRVMDLYIEALISLVGVKVHTKGTEKLPQEGRFLMVCNHLFVADPGVLLNVFPKSQLAFITKKENMALPFINKFMHKILCQPMDRNDDRQALKVILKCIQLIKDDEVSVCVFPEGYTSKDGKLHHFRSGVFKIAQKTKVPIVVCTIQNTKAILPNLKKLRRTDVELHLVDVIQPEQFAGMNTVSLADMVYEKMIGDLGEDFRTPKEETT